jgi:hypothetical protein
VFVLAAGAAGAGGVAAGACGQGGQSSVGVAECRLPEFGVNVQNRRTHLVVAAGSVLQCGRAPTSA